MPRIIETAVRFSRHGALVVAMVLLGSCSGGASGDNGAPFIGTPTGGGSASPTSSSTGSGGSSTNNGGAGTSGSGGAEATLDASPGAGGTGGSAGTSDVATDAASTGTGDAGAVPTTGMDTPAPPKPVTDKKGKHEFRFSAASLDPDAKNGHQGDSQIATVDTSKDLKWKLCLVLPGIGNGPGMGTGGWMAAQGYHVFQVAYDNTIAGAPDNDKNPDTVGNTRMEQFDGKDRTPWITTARADSIEERTVRALKHLAEVDPMGGWGWYLNADGTVRWSDGCFFGYSYGATHAAIISVYVRVGLVVSASGPWTEGSANGTWMTIPSATPPDRGYAIFGMMDGRYAEYAKVAAAIGWPGAVVHTTSTATAPATKPWYEGSHVINVDDQGHTEFCASNHPYCSWMFQLDGH